jgi:hypothetical protein
VQRRQLVKLGALCVAALAGAAFGGYVLGSRTAAITVFTANAYVGIAQASAAVDGTFYGIPSDVVWQGGDGGWRESGFPSCLTPPGTYVRIRFGVASVPHPDDTTWRQVVWVSCIA